MPSDITLELICVPWVCEELCHVDPQHFFLRIAEEVEHGLVAIDQLSVEGACVKGVA